MKKILLKILRIGGGIIGTFMVAFFIFYLIFNEPLPTGEAGAKADALAEKMLAAIHKNDWDATGVVQWNYRKNHHYLWDKRRNWVRVSWGEYQVFVVLDELNGVAFKNGKRVSERQNARLVRKAWAAFANDSFWLNAPAKAFDPGTERRLVRLKNGGDALLVSYTAGGVTPGDSYLWILDENGLPQAWKMWVKIIPIGGIEATWEDWKTLETGAKVATKHRLQSFEFFTTNLKTASDLEAFGFENDPFSVLQN